MWAPLRADLGSTKISRTVCLSSQSHISLDDFALKDLSLYTEHSFSINTDHALSSVFPGPPHTWLSKAGLEGSFPQENGD